MIMPFVYGFILLLVSILLGWLRGRKLKTATDWPLLGMFPALVRNVHRIPQFMTEILEETGGTCVLKGPWFVGNMSLLYTSDPQNVHYILTKNFANFGKGPEFKKIFEPLGNGIFVAENELWENQRKTAKSFMGTTNFHDFSARITWSKIETGLFPILKSASITGMEVDLQEIFQRLAFDCTFQMVLGHDPNSLRIDMPDLPEEKAFVPVEEAALYRHVIPQSLWKVQQWLHIGPEQKGDIGMRAIYEFVSKWTELKSREPPETNDMLSCYRRSPKVNLSPEVWRDATVSLVFAGKDTISSALSWFFFLIATNPDKERILRREIGDNWRFSGVEDLRKLVYLHAALCETLRLFPPVPMQHKSPTRADVLPSGHLVKANTKIIMSFYAMGRAESIWGKDSREFKPERWISDEGTIVSVPSYKFPAFNAGPRSCIGKEISFLQLKIVAAAIASRFKIKAIEEHLAVPSTSIVLHMKHGLKAQVYEHE